MRASPSWCVARLAVTALAVAQLPSCVPEDDTPDPSIDDHDWETDEGANQPVAADDDDGALPPWEPPGELAAPANCTPSRLFGRDGEQRARDGRLIDYAYAGYHTGLDPIPRVSGPTRSVIDFGATPDDNTDDSAAFAAAIAGTPRGVLLVPAGRYVITRRLEIKKSNFVLRGDGQDRTTLLMPKSLGDLFGFPRGKTTYSFNDAFLKASGRDSGSRLATIGKNAARGATTLEVSSAAGIQAGQLVRVVQKDAGGTLFRALHGGEFPGNADQDGGKEVFHFYSKVTRVDGRKVTLERPLPFEIDTRWSPEVRAAKPTVKEVGIEDLTLEFAPSTYGGHFNERGFNAIEMRGLHDSWIRNVRILNADYGITVSDSFFCTVTDVVLDTTASRGNLVGHHGLNSSGGNDVLFTRFDVRKKFVHDLTVDGYAMATVWSNGRGVDLNMDHHGRAPYGTLWTRLDMGAGKRPFGSGGSSNRMPHSGAFSTFWNLTARAEMSLPASDFGPLLNFVGVKAKTPSSPRASWSIETVDAAQLCQADLHAFAIAQRKAAAGR